MRSSRRLGLALSALLLSTQVLLAQVIPSGPRGSINFWSVGGTSVNFPPSSTAGQCLQSQGTGADLAWGNCLPALPPINTNQIYLNTSGQNAAPIGQDVNRLLDTVGYDIARPPAPYSIIYKGNVLPLNNWLSLPPGPANRILVSGGPTAPPAWLPPAAPALGTICITPGAILYYDPVTSWSCLSPGTTGSLLQTNGGIAPSWVPQSSIAVPASSLTGTTLAANVVASSLTSVGTLTSGALGTGFTPVGVAQGGTGLTNMPGNFLYTFAGANDTAKMQSAVGSAPYVNLSANITLTSTITLPLNFVIYCNGNTIFTGAALTTTLNMGDQSQLVNCRLNGQGAGNPSFTGDMIEITTGNNQRLINVDIVDTVGYNLTIAANTAINFAWIGGSFNRTTATNNAILMPATELSTSGIRRFIGLVGNGSWFMDTAGGRLTMITDVAASCMTFGSSSAYTLMYQVRLACAPTINGTLHQLRAVIFDNAVTIGNGATNILIESQPGFTITDSSGNNTNSVLPASGNTYTQYMQADNTIGWSLNVGANNRLLIGTDVSGNSYIRTQNTLDLNLGVNSTNYINIKNSGATTLSGKNNIHGTILADNANAGDYGEYTSADVPIGSALTLTSATPLTITSLSLTAGDWEVGAMCGFTGNAATTVTALLCSFSTTTNVVDTTDGRLFGNGYSGFTVYSNLSPRFTAGPTRFSLGSTTTVFLVEQSTHAVNTSQGFGFLWARRMR